MGDNNLTTVQRQVWAVGIYDRYSKNVGVRVVGNDRLTNIIRLIVENSIAS